MSRVFEGTMRTWTETNLVDLVLTTTKYTFNSQFYQLSDGIAMGGLASYAMCRLMSILQYLRHYTLQKFGNELLMTFIPSLTYGLGKLFLSHQQFSSKYFVYALLKRNNGKVSVLVYRKLTHTDQYLYCSSQHQTSCLESVVSSLFSRAYSIITNKDDLTKENYYQSQPVSVTTTSASNRYPRGRDQNKYKFAVRWSY